MVGILRVPEIGKANVLVFVFFLCKNLPGEGSDPEAAQRVDLSP